MKPKLSILFAFLALVVIFTLACSGKDSTETCEPIQEEKQDLTEKEEEKEEEEEEEKEKIEMVEKTNPVTVVIGNCPDARPSSGLQESSIVYEFLVEGSITRLLAVYDNIEEDLTIGPVRSLRPYFGVKATEYDGAVAHSGYSNRTRSMVSNLGLNQIVSGNYFWRSSSRRAPHNLYTNIDNLYQAVGGAKTIEKEISKENVSFDFEEAKEVEVRYGNNNVVTYKYDDDKEAYLRFNNNSPHKDLETGKQYYATKVIIQETPHQSVSGTNLVDINLEGSGQGVFYKDAKKYEITWEKKDEETCYYYEDGTQINLERGNTWIQIVP